MMRISGWMMLAAALAINGLAGAQDEIEIKADTEASRKAQFEQPADQRNAQPVAAPKRETPVLAQKEKVVLATWDGGELTNEEVSRTLSMRQPINMGNVDPARFSTITRKQQNNILKQLAWERILLKKALAAGVTAETPAVARQLSMQDDMLLNRIFYEKQVKPALAKNTLETAREYYNEKKDELFTEPAETVVRAVHVSTYEMVTAEEGDTLRELATEISGDADAAMDIREALPPFYLRSTPPELDDKMLSAPLDAGEVLFVPLGDDAVASATKLAESLRKQLAAGKSVDDIEAETTDADFTVTVTQPVRLSTAVGYWDELMTAARGLGETSVSQVVKTPTGLNILVLEDHRTTSVVPFSKVEQDLTGRVVTDETQKRATIEKTRKDVLDNLWKKYDVQVNTALVGRKNYIAEDITTDTAVATAGDFKYTLDQFLMDLRMTGKTWGELAQEERMEVLRIAPSLNTNLIAKEARALGIDKTEEYQKAIEGMRDSLIVKEYLRENGPLKNRRISDERLRTYYDANLDKYTSAAQVTLREISKRINMTLTPDARAEAIKNARQSLTEIRSRIKSEEDFAQLARRESEAISTRSRGGLIGTVSESFRGAAFKNELRQIQVGDVSEPFLYGSEVMIVRIDARTPPTVQPFEQVRRQVMMDFAATEPGKMVDEEMETDLKAAGFVLKL